MRRFVVLLVVFAMGVGSIAPIVMAATTATGPISVGAEVGNALAIQVDMRQDSFSGARLTSMDFGILTPTASSGATQDTLRSASAGSAGVGAVVVLLQGNSQGVPYTISQTGTLVTSGANTLPSGALNVVPVYSPSDNAGASLPAGAVLGSPGTWVGTRTLFSSGPTGALRTIQAIYSVTDDPAAGATASIPSDQPAGIYSGVVTFTVTT